MMGYYLTTASPVEIISFGKARRLGSQGGEVGDVSRSNIGLVTDGGLPWTYNRYALRVWRLTFRLSPTELEVFRTLDAAVDGEVTPFYFVPVIDASPLVVVLVRKEKDFRPIELPTRVSVGGVSVLYYEYTLELTEVPTDESVLA